MKHAQVNAGAEAEADRVLVERIARGDVVAMGALYDRRARQVFAVAMRIMRDRTEAEDVVHAFLALHDHAASFSPDKGTVVAWLHALVKNRAIDKRRRQSRRLCILATHVVHEHASASPDVQSAALANDVARVIEGMSDVQRRTLRLVFVEGLSLPEVARREGICLGTAKSRAARALAGVRSAVAFDLAS